MSINNLMSIARTALMTHQQAIDITGHNIANVNTPGYSRQRLELAAAVPLRTPIGTIGRGVTATGIMSYRDVLLDAAYRREQGAFAHSDTLRGLLGGVEQILGEPSDVGISAALDAVFNAFSDLAQTPASASARVAVRDAVQQLTNRIREVDGRLASQQVEISGQISGTVARINQIGQQVAALNLDIVAASSGGAAAPDLQDARDLLLDELATLVGTRVLPREDGSLAVIVGDALLVEGAFPQSLDVRTVPGGGFAAGIVGSPRNLKPGGGVLGALTDLSTGGIPGVRSELDRLASGLVTTMNALHAAGTTLGGSTGVNLFDPAGLTAGTIGLSAAILANPQDIVSGASSQPGDNTVALQLAGLRTTPIASLNGGTAGEFFAGLVSSVATMVRDADQGARIGDQIVAGITARRESVRGVSSDEEMVKLIVQQQAFSAAARLVTVADELMQDVLRMV